MPQVDHVTRLGGIPQLDWQTKSCKRATESAGTDYVDLDCQGLTFVPSDCASRIIWREADRPLNVFEALTGLFPLLTGREPPFEEALDWLQFTYTVDQAGAYVAPVSTVLAQSKVAEGDELFTALLAHLRRRYPKMYGSAVGMCWAPECRDIQIRGGEGLSGGNYIVHSSIKLGAYAGR